jgi:hypothetical protein
MPLWAQHLSGFFFWWRKYMADLKTVIEESASGPAQASVDGQSVTQHNIKDLIEADKYLAQKAAATTNSRLKTQ